MESFYIDPKDIKNGVVEIKGEEFHHLARVSRKRVGELIYLFDGGGKIYTAKIVNITREKAKCEIIAEEFMKGEIDVDIAVAQAILKNPERFEFAIEKLTELGTKCIIPLITERVIPAKSLEDISRNKIERWKKIILSACKQSNRALIPKLCEPVDFKSFVTEFTEYDKKVIFHESDEFKRILLYNYLERMKGVNSILVATGPEGGFTSEEIKLAVNSGFDVISLGERRLRSETASIIGVGVLIQFFIASKRNG
ncbi:16S rRNA (uracil1498-N3)-methyltransferase [Candidatus Kryptobacter tengchongensis]|nr:16S rRNA (uracil1498-N3)-methyltransferase [Candidatus Kryptobacter tengchongensis]